MCACAGQHSNDLILYKKQTQKAAEKVTQSTNIQYIYIYTNDTEIILSELSSTFECKSILMLLCTMVNKKRLDILRHSV